MRGWPIISFSGTIYGFNIKIIYHPISRGSPLPDLEANHHTARIWLSLMWVLNLTGSFSDTISMSSPISELTDGCWAYLLPVALSSVAILDVMEPYLKLKKTHIIQISHSRRLVFTIMFNMTGLLGISAASDIVISRHTGCYGTISETEKHL